MYRHRDPRTLDLGDLCKTVLDRKMEEDHRGWCRGMRRGVVEAGMDWVEEMANSRRAWGMPRAVVREALEMPKAVVRGRWEIVEVCQSCTQSWLANHKPRQRH